LPRPETELSVSKQWCVGIFTALSEVLSWLYFKAFSHVFEYMKSWLVAIITVKVKYIRIIYCTKCVALILSLLWLS